MNRLKLAQELQECLMRRPQAGPIPVPASLIDLVLGELRFGAGAKDGFDLAAEADPEARAQVELLRRMSPQLLIVFLRRLGRAIDIPVAEIDDTGGELLAFSVDENKVFHFELQRKQ